MHGREGARHAQGTGSKAPGREVALPTLTRRVGWKQSSRRGAAPGRTEWGLGTEIGDGEASPTGPGLPKS